MLVDFHVHSTASDGSDEPRAIVREAAQRGFAALALTDHDTTDGVATLRDIPDGVRFFAGVELSVEPGTGFDTFHLLGLGIDPEAPPLAELLAKTRAGRDARNAEMSARFEHLGLDISAEATRLAGGAVLARPHFAKALVARGTVKTLAEAFATYLLPEAPETTRCYVPRWRPPSQMAIAAIHAAGGLAVMAHPKFWRRIWKREGPDYTLASHGLAVLREQGLDGLEALYQANEPAENVGFALLADRLGLVKTAGSDYHGANKAGITLGMDVSEPFARPLLERLDYRQRQKQSDHSATVAGRGSETEASTP